MTLTLRIVRTLIADGLDDLGPGQVLLLDQWLMEHGYEPTWSDRPAEPSSLNSSGPTRRSVSSQRLQPATFEEEPSAESL